MDENDLRGMMQGGPLSLAIKSFFISLFGPFVVFSKMLFSVSGFFPALIIGIFVQYFSLRHPRYAIAYLIFLLGWNSIQFYKVDTINRLSYSKMNETISDMAAKALRDGPQKMFSDEKNA